jgi:hypothetical protein
MKDILRRALISVLLLLVGSLPAVTPNVFAWNGNGNVVESHCTCLHNATEKKVVTTWGGSAYITFTDPNLSGGSASYHRVATVEGTTGKFVEWGWVKTPTGFYALLAWNDGGIMGVQQKYFTGVSGATHRYSHQYDPNTGNFWFYVDGAYYTYQNANFSSGTFEGAGGEAGQGVESFNSTLLYNLRYLQNTNGTFTFVSWNGHVNDVDNAPYYNANGSDSNSFYDKR